MMGYYQYIHKGRGILQKDGKSVHIYENKFYWS